MSDGAKKISYGIADGGTVDAGLPETTAPDAGATDFQVVSPGFGFPEVVPLEPLLSGQRPGAAEATAAVTAGYLGGPDPREVLPPLAPAAEPAPAVEAPPAPPAAMSAPAARPLAPPGLGGVRRELAAGLEEQRAAVTEAARIEGDKAAASLAVRDEYIRRRSALREEHRAQLAQHQATGDELFSDILSARIEPNRIWATMDMGQRVGATIAMVLGGLGAALAGGQNLGLQQIQRLIDRDIDAQKANLAQRHGRLAIHLQRGREMIDAYQLAEADLKDMVAGQLLRVAASFAGPEATARAQAQAGALRTDAAAKRADILTREFAMRQQSLELEQKLAHERMIQAVVGAPRTRAGGIDVPAEALEALPKDMRERAVQLPDGSYGFARTTKQANDYTAGRVKLEGFQTVLGEYRQLLLTEHPVIPTAIGGERTRANALRQDILLRLKDLKELGVLQKLDVDALEPLIPDITSVLTRDRTLLQGLDALEDTVLADAAASAEAVVGRRAPKGAGGG